MQQTRPKVHDPLGRPPNSEQVVPLEQIPDSPLGEVQLPYEANGWTKFGLGMKGNLLPNPANGLKVFAGVNLLLNIPVLMSELPKFLNAIRFSGSPLFLSFDAVL